MVSSGFMAVIGFWNIMAISCPRYLRISVCVSLSRFVPLYRICPCAISAFELESVMGTWLVFGVCVMYGMRFSIDSASVVLPQPDSPASPSVVPVGISSVTLSTALIVPCGV